MRRPQGLATVYDPGSDVPIREVETFTCRHCQRVVEVEPRADPASMGGICSGCGKLICPGCVDRRQAGANCVPWEEAMRRMMARQDALRSYGLA